MKLELKLGLDEFEDNLNTSVLNTSVLGRVLGIVNQQVQTNLYARAQGHQTAQAYGWE